MPSIANRITELRQQIDRQSRLAGRDPAAVSLIAVSKRQPVELIRAAYAAGQRDFGENYLQEALEKIAQLKEIDCQWHFIGQIQSRKAKEIAANFDWVHTIDRLKVAEKLSQHRPASLPPLNVLIQVNLEAEPQKAGVSPAAAFELATQIEQLPQLHLRGLMAIPAAREDMAEQQGVFAKLAALQKELNDGGFALDQLSMGMSNDFAAAINAGSTLLRIGTAVFGPRA